MFIYKFFFIILNIMYDRVALLIPATSRTCNYEKFYDTDLYNYTLTTFFKTYDPQYIKYTFYIGFDDDDEFYKNKLIKSSIIRFIKKHNCDVKINYFKGEKGNVVDIWNRLYKQSYEDNDYFVQCGSDISFIDKGWVSSAIQTFLLNDNYGVVGLVDSGRRRITPTDRLFTQTMVSKKHYDIFGFYYPPQLKNWFCDDWITEIYRQHDLAHEIPFKIINLGGQPRYNIHGDRKLCNDLILGHIDSIDHYRMVESNLNNTKEAMNTIAEMGELGYDYIKED